MARVGFIDDDNSTVEDYKKKLSRKDIALYFVEDCRTMESVLEWILDNNIECMLVDYKLTDQYPYNGTSLIAFINKELPDLPCIMLTNNSQDGIGENLVIEKLFVDRKIFNEGSTSEEFNNFTNMLKQAVNVFNKRFEQNLEEFAKLKKKKEDGKISALEDEKYFSLYKILRAYDFVDDIPAKLLDSQVVTQIEVIINSLDDILKKHEGSTNESS